MIMCEQNASLVFYEKLDKLLCIDQFEHEQLLWVTNVLQHINMGMGFSFAPEYLLRFLNDHVKIIQTDQALPKLGLYATFNKNSQNPALKMITQALHNTTSI